MPNRHTTLTLITALVLSVSLAACYEPTRPETLNCSSQGQCPGTMVCQSDKICREFSQSDIDAGTSDSDGRPQAVDAAPEIDATPVECRTSADCQTTPDLCHLPGTCDIDNNLCVFPKVTCNAGETCATHQCNPDSGNCETISTNEGATCDTQTCTGFGLCAFDSANTCAENGLMTRSCTEFVCTSGSCVGTTTDDTMSCSRVTTGEDCNGGTTCMPATACDSPVSQCTYSGTSSQRCTDRTCAAGSCVSAARIIRTACIRNTDGLRCGIEPCETNKFGIQEICCVAESCNQLCGVCDDDATL